ILYKNLKDSGIPQSTLASFKDYYLSIAARNIIKINALEQIEGALGRDQIEVMTLKGASLFNTTYPDIGMRPMGDLDLMVSPDKQQRFVNLLYDLGYRKNPLLPHIFNKDRVVIDMHTHAMNIDRIANRAGLFPAGMGPIWSKSIPWREDCKWLRRPDEVDNILLLSQHCMKHSFSKLIWLVDILRIIRTNDFMFMSDLLKRSDYLQQGKSLSYTLYLLNRIFYHETERNLVPEGLSQGISRLERGILEAKANGESIEFIGPIISMSCVQGFSNKIALGWESLFPKNEIVKQGVTRPYRFKSFCFYPSRFWKIVAHLLKRFCLILGYIIRGG
ncbi:MAG TPA: nucleotidyltransferase family protein, partial [Desulfatiglandales bacterium]|nr:nucleotidyltransferase family protein [Desulfatiglandales bacterium]